MAQFAADLVLLPLLYAGQYWLLRLYGARAQNFIWLVIAFLRIPHLEPVPQVHDGGRGLEPLARRRTGRVLRGRVHCARAMGLAP